MGIGVAVGVGTDVGDGATVGVAVGVGIGTAVGVAVGTGVADGVGSAVGEGTEDIGGVDVADSAVGLGDGTGTVVAILGSAEGGSGRAAPAVASTAASTAAWNLVSAVCVADMAAATVASTSGLVWSIENVASPEHATTVARSATPSANCCLMRCIFRLTQNTRKH